MTLDTNDKKELAEEIAKHISSTITVSPETHENHHRWLEEEIDCARRKRLRNEAIKKQVIGWGIISILSAIAIAVADYAHYIIQGGGDQ